MKATLKSDRSQSAHELLLSFDVSKQTVLTHLAPIGNVYMLAKSVTHQLNENRKKEPLATVVKHVLCFYVVTNNESILNVVVTWCEMDPMR